MFGLNPDFERNVLLEIDYSKKMRGEAALDFARLRASRPRLRRWRRKVLMAAVRRLERESRSFGVMDWLTA